MQLLGPRAEWSGGSTNVWAALFDAIPPASVPGHHAVFVVWGFEELMDHTGQENWDIVRQFNIQRDLFVRDYPCWWVLLLHPASRQHWLKNAPDISDFVALWIEAPLRAVVHEDVGVRDRATSLHVESASGGDRADWPEPLRLAREDILAARLDAALDRIHSFRAATSLTPQTVRDLAIADLLESDVLVAHGFTQPAVTLLRDKVHPVLQRLAESDPANAVWQRDLWVSYCRVASVLEQQQSPDATAYWQKAHNTLTAIEAAGLFVSDQDRQFLTQLRSSTV